MSDRDIRGDYKAALLYELESYKRAGRDDDATAVEDVLREQFDHEPEEEKPEPRRRGRPPKERADALAPERAVPEKPAHPSKDDAKS